VLGRVSNWRRQACDWLGLTCSSRATRPTGNPACSRRTAATLNSRVNFRRVFALKAFIQDKEERLTRESIQKTPQQYSLLSGTDFERLLKRLFAAMGYEVQHIGQAGDQGGDLIANKGGERILIQAKCYRDWSVGNSAVQQAVAAMKFYDCNKAMVITTSEKFTKEAVSLAKANSIELVSKVRLSELLVSHLQEAWY
jgi:HJR/Mrr/RecB family endonuclease